MSMEDLTLVEEKLDEIKISNEIYKNILDLVSESRKLKNGNFSTRAAIAVINASKGYAYIQGEDYVTPDHVQLKKIKHLS